MFKENMLDLRSIVESVFLRFAGAKSSQDIPVKSFVYGSYQWWPLEPEMGFRSRHSTCLVGRVLADIPHESIVGCGE